MKDRRHPYRINDKFAHHSYPCPRCKQKGFLPVRWTRTCYYPQWASLLIYKLQEYTEKLAENPEDEKAKSRYVYWTKEIARGQRFRGMEDIRCLDRDKKSVFYRVYKPKYWRTYMGHYDRDVYRKQMEDYKSGKRKSRPNGRRWCLLGVIN